jgi:hypothetical protein
MHRGSRSHTQRPSLCWRRVRLAWLMRRSVAAHERVLTNVQPTARTSLLLRPLQTLHAMPCPPLVLSAAVESTFPNSSPAKPGPATMSTPSTSAPTPHLLPDMQAAQGGGGGSQLEDLLMAAPTPLASTSSSSSSSLHSKPSATSAPGLPPPTANYHQQRQGMQAAKPSKPPATKPPPPFKPPPPMKPPPVLGPPPGDRTTVGAPPPPTTTAPPAATTTAAAAAVLPPAATQSLLDTDVPSSPAAEQVSSLIDQPLPPQPPHPPPHPPPHEQEQESHMWNAADTSPHLSPPSPVAPPPSQSLPNDASIQEPPPPPLAAHTAAPPSPAADAQGITQRTAISPPPAPPPKPDAQLLPPPAPLAPPPPPALTETAPAESQRQHLEQHPDAAHTPLAPPPPAAAAAAAAAATPAGAQASQAMAGLGASGRSPEKKPAGAPMDLQAELRARLERKMGGEAAQARSGAQESKSSGPPPLSPKASKPTKKWTPKTAGGGKVSRRARALASGGVVLAVARPCLFACVLASCCLLCLPARPARPACAPQETSWKRKQVGRG